MNAKNIQRVNEAIYILRNFIDLSAQLLPFLSELHYSKKVLTDTDLEDKKNIIEVFNTYSFDQETSRILMNSPILEKIQKSFTSIIDSKSSRDKSKRELLEFRKEHKKLMRSWTLIDAN
jgi:hypothetical protein